MKKVFVSYSQLDNEARYFLNYLRDKFLSFDFEILSVYDIVSSNENFHYSIVEKINECRIFVAFINKENPNVMFEIGYALGRNKKIIVVGDSQTIPFDLKSMLFIKRGSSPIDIIRKIETYVTDDEIDNEFIESMGNPFNAIDAFIHRPELLESLDSYAFEKVIGDWFTGKGYDIESLGQRPDKGYDFIISQFRDGKALVEVKKYRSASKVPISVIRQLIGVMTVERIHTGIVISSAPFTNSAKLFVQEVEPIVYLWTIDDLHRMNNLSKYEIERIDFQP